MLAAWRTRLSTRRPDAGAAPLRARLPSLCAICHGWGRGRVCATCLDSFAPKLERCARCALPVPAGVSTCGSCLSTPPAFDAAVACVDYGAPWDRLVTAFKFHAALDLAPVFAAAMADAVAAAGRPARASPAATPAATPATTPTAAPTAAPAATPAAPTPTPAPMPATASAAAAATLVLPVPLAPQRLRERGYNQAWELARRTARHLGLRADATLLLRLRETAHQLSLLPPARIGNVRGAFAVEPRRRVELAGRSVAIVDDVMTTGSTAEEIAAVLKHAGATHVSVWVFARTPRPGE